MGMWEHPQEVLLPVFYVKTKFLKHLSEGVYTGSNCAPTLSQQGHSHQLVAEASGHANSTSSDEYCASGSVCSGASGTKANIRGTSRQELASAEVASAALSSAKIRRPSSATIRRPSAH